MSPFAAILAIRAWRRRLCRFHSAPRAATRRLCRFLSAPRTQPDSSALGGASSLDDRAHWYLRYIARPDRPAAVRPPLIRAGQVSPCIRATARIRINATPPQREESPESRRLFGAGLGARSPQRTPRGKHSKANAPAQKRTKATPSAPFSLLRPPHPRHPVEIAIKKRTNPK